MPPPELSPALLDPGLSGTPVPLMLGLAALSLAPFAALLISSFTKIVVVLSIARSAMGTQNLPPSIVITGLAAVLSLHVMSPTLQASWAALRAGDGALEVATLTRRAGPALAPIRAFLERHAEPQEIEAFAALAEAARDPELRPPDADSEGLPFTVLLPAFLVSELSEAFHFGFLIFLPFLIIDLTVGTVLLSLGMHMLSPTTVSLPFKLLLFVAADGWRLLAEGLVSSYLGGP